MGHRQKKIYPADLLLLWPGEVGREREDDSSRTGLALLAGTNKSELGRFFFLLMPHFWQFPFKVFPKIPVEKQKPNTKSLPKAENQTKSCKTSFQKL